MGSLRTLFAISVVFAHSYGFVFVGGRNAVQLFYVISGFLISYVLVENKTYANLKDFYINRCLRLYPIYFVVAILTLLAYVAIGNPGFFEVYDKAPMSASMLLILSNILLFGQDWVMFSGVENNALLFVTDFRKSEVALFMGLLAPQAWTLGVELSFYLVAPFILTRRRAIYTLLALSVAARIYLVSIGLGTRDPWAYRFFPTELALFLMGALAHQVLLPRYKNALAGRMQLASGAATAFLLAISAFYYLVPMKDSVRTLLLFTAFIALMPLTFVFQSNNRFDKFIGDLSYPIYIGHVLVIFLVMHFAPKFGVDHKLLIGLGCVLLSVVFAVLLNAMIGTPLERLRSRFRKMAESTRPRRSMEAPEVIDLPHAAHLPLKP